MDKMLFKPIRYWLFRIDEIIRERFFGRAQEINLLVANGVAREKCERQRSALFIVECIRGNGFLRNLHKLHGVSVFVCAPSVGFSTCKIE